MKRSKYEIVCVMSGFLQTELLTVKRESATIRQGHGSTATSLQRNGGSGENAGKCFVCCYFIRYLKVFLKRNMYKVEYLFSIMSD